MVQLYDGRHPTPRLVQRLLTLPLAVWFSKRCTRRRQGCAFSVDSTTTHIFFLIVHTSKVNDDRTVGYRDDFNIFRVRHKWVGR